MMATCNIVSVGVEVGSSIELFKLNKQEKLSNIIEELCNQNSKVSYVENKYAFQFIRDQSNNKLASKYVTEENMINIIDGTELKLVYSPAELSRMIYDHLKNNDSDICWALEKLAGHINDPVFVSEVFSPCYPAIMEKINSGILPSKLYCYCLKAILGFLKFDYIQEVDPLLIEKLFKNISTTSQMENIIIEHSFRVLEQSVAKNQYSLIANSIDIKDLVPYLWNKEAPLVQESALTLINNIVFYCPCEETKSNITKVMNSCKFLSTISSNILYHGAEPSSEMAEQLYLYQTMVLSTISDRLNPFLLDCASLPDSELVSENKRHSNFESSASESAIEFNAESTGSSSRNSREMSLSSHVDRISNGWKSEGMYSKGNNLVLSFLNLEMSELNKEIKYLEEMPDLKTINQLVYDCIIYFSKHYRKNYQISLCTEGCQNFISICYDVVNLIIYNLLNFGKELVKGSTTYYPLVFSATKKQPFMEELFCVAMWLFERTKREMKSRTYEDYKKLLKIMERQLKEGLSVQPKTYRELESTLRRFTYSSVRDQWQIEREAKEQQFFKTSLAVKELRKMMKGQIIQLIKKQRLNYIIKGSKFPVWNSLKSQRVKNKFWFARLSSNQKVILYATDIEDESDEFTDLQSLPLRDVEEFVVGKKCPHLKDFKSNSKDKKEIPLGFSLITDRNLETSLDFVVNSREVYEYWVDALNTLFGNKMKSNQFKEELSTLLRMELKIQLLDVEGIDCPIEPPPIPPSPDNYDFFSE